VAIGKHTNFEKASAIVKNPINEMTQPNPSKNARYAEMFKIYEQLEMSLEPFFQPRSISE
jgi:ribulose kinase